MSPTPETSPRVYSVSKSRSSCAVQIDVEAIHRLGCEEVFFQVIDSSPTVIGGTLTRKLTDGTSYSGAWEGDCFDLADFENNEEITITFNSESGVCDAVVISAEYYKDGALVYSSLVQNGNCELRLLKYKVELPRGAKVTLFDDDSLEAQFVAWNLPCPNTLPNMTFLQVKAANGFEQQITPSAGSQTIELYQELGRRYAVFGEIWTYSFAQTLWFADLKIQLSNYDWVDIVPTAGEGGTIVTALPQ